MIGGDYVSNAVLKIINNTVANAENNAVSGEDDYIGEDGLLVCGECGENKQALMDFKGFGGMKPRPRMCRCDREKEEELRKEFEEGQRRMHVENLRSMGITDKSYYRYTFSQDDNQNSKISVACKRYADNFAEMLCKNQGLLFCGKVGTGKTFFAVCIANAVLEQCRSVLVTNIPALMNSLSGNQDDKNYTLKQIAKVDLLVLDDLGVERDTSYATEKIYEIIDTRYRAGKPLIVTTNLKASEMRTCEKDSYKRIYDRILERCYVIPVLGESRRTKEAERNEKEMKKFLGV